ncbi:MAG: CPBP family glutamic-type intramembrane protease [Egibacteraceae bacterium]
MSDALESAVRSLAIVVTICLFYRWGLGRGAPDLDRVLGWLVAHVRSTRSYSVKDLEAIVWLGLWSLLQAVFMVVLVAVSGLDVAGFFSTEFHPVFILYGVFIGIGEVALVSLFSYALSGAAMRVTAGGAAMDMSKWFNAARTGWRRVVLKPMEVAPLSLILPVIMVSLVAEEAVFRGVVLTNLRSAGGAIALATSIVLFVTARVMGASSWPGRLSVGVEALVVGTVHAALYLSVPNLIPLVIAQEVYVVTKNL